MEPKGVELEASRTTETAEERAKQGRLVSLDAFRGLTIVSMLLVNNIALDADTPPQLQHAGWNAGIHFADLVFPWFLLIVGVALPWSVASLRKRGVKGLRLIPKVLGRTLSLYLLGCLVDSTVAHRPILGLGVLQLIGLAYCGGSLLYGLPAIWRATAALALLAGHWAAIRYVPVPGAGPGIFLEEQNLIRHINETYLQPIGLKGLVSALPTTALVAIGTLAGDWLRGAAGGSRREALLRGAGLLGGGGLLTVAGWAWSLDLPFNKPVWTASYILFAGGTGLLVLGLLYLTIDAARLRLWSFPLVVFGSNAIIAYVAPILVKIQILQEWTWPNPGDAGSNLQEALLRAAIDRFGRYEGGWIYTAGYIGVWWLVLLWLHHRKLFLRV